MHDRASFDCWVQHEVLQKVGQFLCSLLQKLWVLVADVLFLWEAGGPICFANLFSHHGLKLSDRRVPISQVELNVVGANKEHDVICHSFISQILLYYEDFKVKRAIGDLFYHHNCVFLRPFKGYWVSHLQ